MLEKDYPYTSGATGDDSNYCQYDKSKATNVTVKDWEEMISYKISNYKALLAR